MPPPLDHQRRRGIVFILLCAVVWALTVTWCKWRLDDVAAAVRLTPGHFTLAEVAGLATVGGFWCLLSPRQTLRLPLRTLPLLLVIALCASVGALGFFYIALEQTQQIKATLLGHTQVVFIALIAFAFFGERLRRAEKVGIPLILVGATLITLRTYENLVTLTFDNAADGLILIAAVLWALGGVLSQRLMNRLSGPQILAWRGMIATAVVWGGQLLYSVYHPAISLDPSWIGKLFQARNLLAERACWPAALELGAYGLIVGLGFLCYYLGLERLKASEAASWELTTPFFAMILAYCVLGETLTALQGFGTVLMLGALWRIGRADEMPGHMSRGAP